MNTIAKEVSNLSNTISLTIAKGCYLTIEIGVSYEGNTSVLVNISSGVSSRKISHCSIKGLISERDCSILGVYGNKGVTQDVLLEFNNLLLSINNILNDIGLTSIRTTNNMQSFNIKIKPWSVEITHLDGLELVRAAQMKDCANMFVSDSNGCEYGSFEIGKSITNQQRAYELMSKAFSQTESFYNTLSAHDMQA